MKFADDLLALYHKHFSKEDHLPVFVFSILEQMEREDLIHILQECNEEELQEVLGTYILKYIESNKKKTLTNENNSLYLREHKRKKIH